MKDVLFDPDFSAPYLSNADHRRGKRSDRGPNPRSNLSADRRYRRLRLRGAPLTLKPPTFLAWCVLRSAFRRHPDLFSSPAACVSLRVLRAGDVRHYSAALSILLPLLVPPGSGDPLVLQFDRQRWREREGGGWSRDTDTLVDLACEKAWIAGIHHGSAAPEMFLRLADAEIEVGRPEQAHIRAAAAVLAKVELTDEEVAALERLPLTALAFQLRHGASAARCRGPLKEMHRAAPANVVPLTELAGMDEAVRWGMDLALDLKAWVAGEIRWADVDGAILLHGLPGTGKTLFASSVAAHCGLPLFAASLMEWQSKGHLGDLLGAMYAFFEKAAAARPCIAFLDEVDAFGDRSRFSHDNANYSTQVVNGLLECLDGHGRREGVVVVAACNDVTRLDPALRRAGRLDREVEVHLPDRDARERIILQKARASLPASGLRDVADATQGCSGADLERLIRDARRRARRAGRDLLPQDLLDGGGMAALHPDVIWRAAVHEAGHALVASVLGVGRATSISVARRSTGGPGSIGTTVIEATRVDSWTAPGLLDRVAVDLAGMAAEITVFGEHGTGAGGAAGSDLARATQLLLEMETGLGMGQSLPFRLPAGGTDLRAAIGHDPDLLGLIDGRLREQLRRACEAVERSRGRLIGLARAVVERGELGSDDIAACLNDPTGPTHAVDAAAAGPLRHKI